MPPHALDLLMRLTFPAPSDRVKVVTQRHDSNKRFHQSSSSYLGLSHKLSCFQATERFESIYPTLKEIALTGTGGRAMKQVVQQIARYTIKAAGEGMVLFPFQNIRFNPAKFS